MLGAGVIGATAVPAGGTGSQQPPTATGATGTYHDWCHPHKSPGRVAALVVE